ncbi:MAG: hypothetical protein NVSMB23_25150 [Myxococcales bacterium]
MRCPVCDAENPESSPECQLCGKELLREGPAAAPAPEPVPGLEQTVAAPAPDPASESFAELERTSVGEAGVEVEVQPIEVMRSDAAAAPEGAASFWDAAAPELTLDRAEDDGVRTASPADDGLCAYCGEYALDALCANCGQRRDRFLAPPQRAVPARPGGAERVLCPACFARVPAGPRCIECGLPFPPSMGGAEP